MAKRLQISHSIDLKAQGNFTNNKVSLHLAPIPVNARGHYGGMDAPTFSAPDPTMRPGRVHSGAGQILSFAASRGVIHA